MKSGMAWAVLALSLAAQTCDALQGHRQEPEAAVDVHPVTRVVQLLQDMKGQLEKEADVDEEMYEKMACWCTSNDKGKTKAIEDAEARITQLGATIAKNIALAEMLKVEISALESELAKNRASLETAAALRQKQKAGFIAEEKDMVESIRALDAAVTVLAKHNTGAALVSAKAVVARVAKALEHIRGRGSLLQGSITPRQQRLLAAFAQRASGPTFKAPYQPQSSEIFGILKQMKETFEADLSDSQKEEVVAQTTFNDLEIAKEDEIKSGEASLQDKQQQLAHADSTVAESKEDREDTSTSLSSDKAFLMELKTKCALTDHEWEQRQKMRQDEIAAVAEAIGILTTDDARELFSKVHNAPEFVQVRRRDRSSGRDQAVAVLSKLASAHNDQRFSALATLASSAQLDAFTRVKKAIDDMVAELLQENEEDVQHRDTCTNELNQNERWTGKELHTKENLNSKLEGLQRAEQTLKETILGLQGEISELEKQLQQAKENREKEKAEFDSTVADQKAAQDLLEEALHVLELRYAAKLAALVQVDLSLRGSMPAPADFKAYEKGTGRAPGVLALLKHIIEDSVSLQEEARKAEGDGQDTYTAFVQATSVAVHAKKDSIVDRQAEQAQVEEDISQTKTELEGSMSELESLAKSKADLMGDCDFLFKNFDVRREARGQEVEALRQAKAYLSGMQ
mmetsp:Transcript_126885/g.405823  ORF Transcript_126885/g.405823 Transcript_126885/m.405823 type:complete len:686 (+) Transcript_126885:101-2158(+)